MSVINKNLIYNYVFIVSTPRAGSTLIQSVLANLNGSVTGPETHFFSIMNRKNFLKKEFYFRQRELKELWSEYRGEYNLKCRDLLFKKEKSYFEFKFLVDDFIFKQKGKFFIEKTPKHLWYIQDIRTVFPKALFVHLIRNPFDNVRSLYRATNDYSSGWSGSRSVDQCVSRWKKDISLHLKYIDNVNHIFIDYGDLCSAPIRTAELVANIVGCDVLLDFSMKADASIVKDSEKWKVNNFSEVGVKNEPEFHILEKDFEMKYGDLKGLYHRLKNECI